MYKVVCRAVQVNEPKAIEGGEPIPKSKCPLFELGDKMTFTTWPTRLILEECDNVCIFSLSAIAPATQALCRDTAEGSDYLSNISYFCCPDAHRPVVFRIERIPLPLEQIKHPKVIDY